MPPAMQHILNQPKPYWTVSVSTSDNGSLVTSILGKVEGVIQWEGCIKG